MITYIVEFYFYGRSGTLKHNIIFVNSKPLQVKLTFILSILFNGCEIKTVLLLKLLFNLAFRDLE